MFRLTLFLTLFTLSFSIFSQDLAELEKRNGFKDIKLGMAGDSLKGAKLKKEFKEKNEFPAKLFTIEHPDYTKIGETRVNKIEIKTSSIHLS